MAEIDQSKTQPEDPRTLTLPADKIPFGTDGLSTPTFYADLIRGTMITNGVVKLNLVENRVNATSNEVMSVHVATIILPANQVGAWGTYLTRIADDMQKPDADA